MHVKQMHTRKMGHVFHEECTDSKKNFKVINKKQGSFIYEQTFACYIIKKICLLSGISGLTFDPDTTVMFSTSKTLN